MSLKLFKLFKLFNKKNIPNMITILGLLIVNYSIAMYNLTNKSIYIIYMVIGCLCDYLDGYFARKFKIESNFGNFLDKIVDKINQSIMLITICYKYKQKWVYFYLFIIREIIICVLRYLKIKPSKSSFYGKLKTSIFPLSLILFHSNSTIKIIFLNLLIVFNFATLFL